MKTSSFLALLSSSVVVLACEASPAREGGEVAKRPGEPDVIQVEAEDREMNEAMGQARKTLDEFVAELSAPSQGTALSLKARFEDGDAIEHIWLNNVSVENGVLVGEINNEPLDVANVRLGQRVSVPTEKVSDWLVIRDGVLRGGYTIRVLRSRMPPDEQRALDESMGATFEPLSPDA